MNSGFIHWHGVEAADSFLQTVRQLHYLGVESLVMKRVDFEQLVLSWPEFYLSGPILRLKESWLRGILRRVLRKPKPVVKLQLSNQILENLQARFRDQRAILVDGYWFPVKFWEEMCEEYTGESRQGTREDVHKY